MGLEVKNTIPHVNYIHVVHGAVVYLESDRIAPFIAEIPEFHAGRILPFVKQIDYEEQQEYRFVISVLLPTPINNNTNNTIYLAVSDELRSLMTPLRAVP